MEEINISKPKNTTGEPSAKETPKPTRAVEGSVGQDTAEATKADQQGTTGSGKATNQQGQWKAQSAKTPQRQQRQINKGQRVVAKLQTQQIPMPRCDG
ncbi:hypothetical protein QE152_g33388 [Popillia japonica]|uniref:Uncharacterized protein n=1 Tax=Popillia japonica TaxID=7064 RepID=A0AAW1IXJ7_POPJA